jgi:hypothetical protein
MTSTAGGANVRWRTIDRYLAGECSKAEEVEVEQWVARNPARGLLLKLLAGPNEAELREARATIWAHLAEEVETNEVPH